MARVPTPIGNMVEAQATPGNQLQAPDFGEGGRRIGEAVQRFGGQLVGLGEVQDEINAEADNAGAKLVDTEYSKWSRDELFVRDGAFYTLEGFNASDQRKAVEKRIADKREELLGRATTPRMRKMAADALDRRTGADLEGIARHTTDQIRVAERQQSAARATTSADDAVTYWNDPEQFEAAMAVGRSEIRSLGAKTGAPPAEVARQEREYVSGINGRIARGLIRRGRLEDAQVWREEHAGQMLPKDLEDIDGALYQPMLERRADGIVDGLLGMAPATTDAQGATARSQGAVLPRMVSITAQAESGARERDRSGRLITSSAGAQGKMQVMPGTNRDPGFGVAKAKDDSDAERTRVGRDYLAAMMKRYGNDPAKAWAAYNWGPGRVDDAIAAHGAAWLQQAPKETQAYVRSNLAALGGRGAAQQAPQEHDLTALLGELDGMNLPFDLEQAVRRQLTERVNLDEQLLSRNRDDAAEQAQEIINSKNSTRHSDVPDSVWRAMGPRHEASLRSQIDGNATAAAAKRQSDVGVYTYLSDLYATDPQSFAKVLPGTYAGRLSQSDYDKVLGWRRDALKNAGAAARGEEQVTHERLRGVINSATAGLPLWTARNRGGLKPEQKRARDEWSYRLEGAVAREVQIWQREHPGEKITDQHIQGITDRQLMRWVPEGEQRDDAHPRFWFERPAGEGGRAIVPDREYARIKAIGRRILGHDPSNEQIMKIYVDEATGGH